MTEILQFECKPLGKLTLEQRLVAGMSDSDPPHQP